ncbi:MAG TPA: AraC family transcriptional regulator [Mobilitalea sp.]|nr:AraC family transcriptional regulator [Mobilitalea sp.]
MSELKKKLNIPGDLPDFGALDNGFHNIGGKSFYIYNCFDYGTLITQINVEKFYKMNEISSVLPDYEIVVLDNTNTVFAASSNKARKIMESIDMTKNISKYFNYKNEKYLISNRTMQNGFHFILIMQPSRMQKLQQQYNLIYILAGIFLFAGCILLVYLNANIYRPLKVIAKKYVPSGEKRNEIDIINVKMDEIINENLEMQTQILNNQKIQSDIELNYAIHSKQGISEKLAAQLQSLYGRYRMMAVAVQNQTGGGDELFEYVDDYLLDTLDCKSINIDQFSHAYILPDIHGKEEIISILDKYFENTKPNILVYIGLSEVSGDFLQIHMIYRQCYERMMSNVIPLEKRYVITTDDLRMTGNTPATVSFEILNTIAKYTLNGTPKDIQEILEHIFFSNNAISLQDSISYYSQLSGLLSSLINQTNNVLGASDFKFLQNTAVYNPVYMFYTLLDDYKKLNVGTSQTYTALRYEIIEYINHHYKEALSLESISSVFGITPVYLSSWFKKNTGINLSVYITNIRMEEAKKLLLNNQHMKITDIAAQVGIPGASTFIRQFKNYSGCTPDQYRQMNNLKNMD